MVTNALKLIMKRYNRVITLITLYEYLNFSGMYFVFILRNFKRNSKQSVSRKTEKLKKWMKSINNHIYWTAAGSTSEPERITKWTAILNHVRDVHTQEDPRYPKCEHAIRKTTDKSKWLQAGI